MRARTGRAALILLLLTAAATAGPDASSPDAAWTPAPSEGAEHPVVATLVTDATVLAPDAPFLAGVELRMRPGWHVYWKNPGDAGLSTEITFELPEGFTAGEVRFPVPEVFEQPGNMRGYGYSHPVTLFAEITPPRTLVPGETVPIGVKVDWLACERVCIPGGAKLETTLPVAERATRTDAGDAWVASLPLGTDAVRPFIDSVRSRKDTDGGMLVEIELRWRSLPPADIEWLPATPEAVEISGTTVTTDGQTTQVMFEAVARQGIPLRQKTMETVVAYHTVDGRRHGVVVPVGLGMLASASGS